MSLPSFLLDSLTIDCAFFATLSYSVDRLSIFSFIVSNSVISSGVKFSFLDFCVFLLCRLPISLSITLTLAFSCSAFNLKSCSVVVAGINLFFSFLIFHP